MALHLDIELTESQMETMAAIPATSWFTQIVYRNAQSPIHPDLRGVRLAEKNVMKQALVKDWIVKSVKGKRVLDLFSANGAFAFIAALAGAREVVGVEFDADRVKCAEFVASTIQTDCKITFRQGDVYKIAEYFDEPFDVALCLGGLYHIADPAFVLRQIGNLTKEHLIMQTDHVLPFRGNRAKFIVRRQDWSAQGMTSIRGGYGTWHYSPECLRELLLHGGFKVVEERQPLWWQRRRFHWYSAYCELLQR